MESWRNELYNSLSHSVEGSTWANHKYVAIINGRYIYPEDLQKERASKSGIVTGGTKTVKSSGSSSNSSTDNAQTFSEKEAANPKTIKYTDKGKVKNYRHLPKEPDIGDVYLLEDTKQKVYWNGEIWTPYKEKKKKGNGRGSGEKDSSEYIISPETAQAVRDLINRRNGSSSTSRKSPAKGQGGGR